MSFFFNKAVVYLSLVSSLALPVLAASDQDKFEVAKTKLLYALSLNDFETAERITQDSASQFEGTPLAYDWRYWQGVSLLKQGQLSAAAELLKQLDNSPVSQDLWLFDLAIVELKLGQTHAARGYLDRWLNNHPDDVPGHYYLAMSHYEVGDYQGAISELKPLAQQTHSATSPVKSDAINYLLAASAYQARQFSLASASAKKVLAIPDSAYHETANDILNNIQQLGGVRKWTAEISTKASYDSNVVLGNEDEREGDLRGSFQFDGSFKPVDAINLSYQGTLARHVEITDYDLQTHKLTGEWLTGLQTVETRLGYSYAYNVLSDEAWLTQQRLFVVATQNNLTVEGDLFIQDYVDDDSLNGYLAGITATQRLSGKDNNQPIITASLGGQLHTNKDFENKSIRVNGGAAFISLLSTWQVQAKGDVSYTQYAPDADKESKILFSSSLVGSKLIMSQLRFTVSADTFWTISTPESFDYQRYVISSALAWRF